MLQEKRRRTKAVRYTRKADIYVVVEDGTRQVWTLDVKIYFWTRYPVRRQRTEISFAVLPFSDT